jgi:tRNA pseudouridine55 synthase
MQHTRPEGEVYLMDKPLGWTSFQVVKKVKWVTKSKRVGHAGTLDPLATGLLVICTEKKTKTIASIQAEIKEYTGTIRFGETTPSFDKETPVDHTFATEHIDRAMIEEALKNFTGTIRQTPPLHSAVKIDGQRAYKIARRGETAELKEREIQIHSFELTGFNMPEIDFKVVCSKGTYIRSLARDLGLHLQSGAYLTALRRTRIGPYSIDKALTIADLERLFPKPEPSSL